MPYIGPALETDSFLHDWQAAAEAAGFENRTYGQVEGLALTYAIKQPPSADGAWFFLSTGIHGDEPAGPLAALEFVRQGLLPNNAGAVIFPLLNPEALKLNARLHPEFGDLNRDYLAFHAPHIRAHRDCLRELGLRYTLAICLHEDWESSGYYVYELLTDGRAGIGRAILDTVAPICGVDGSTEIEGVEASNGLITRDLIEIDPEELGGWPEALYLAEHYCGMTYTLEAPSAQALERRINAHLTALKVAMGVLE